jgi:hypothetical protein
MSRRLFLTGSYDSMVRLWNMSGECVATLDGHADAVKSVAFGAATGMDMKNSLVSCISLIISNTLTCLENEAVVFSSSLDQTVMAWEVSTIG